MNFWQPDSFAWFQEFMVKEWASENSMFWKLADEFEDNMSLYDFDSEGELRIIAEAFLLDDAIYPLNISYKVPNAFTTAYQSHESFENICDLLSEKRRKLKI